MLDKDARIKELEAEVARLKEFESARLKEFEVEVARLKSIIEELLLRLNKNSSNSSKPPSSDMVRTRSQRPVSGKKSGGQSGHSGSTLQMSSHADEVTYHKPDYCKGCGKDISYFGSRRYERRQVYDIPPISLKIREHRSVMVCCPHCQTENKGAFPEGVTHPVQYGSNIKGLCTYLTQYQLLPYKRSVEMIEELTGHRMSVGTLVNINERCEQSLSGFMESVKQSLQQEPVIHSDETGFYFDNKRNWLHVAASKNYTCYYTHSKRGTVATEEMGILSEYKGTMMHDYWKSYLDYDCSHVFCHAHHLRDLDFCHQQEKSRWAAGMKKLLLEMKSIVDYRKAQKQQQLEALQLHQLEAKFEQLLEEGQKEHPPPLKQEGKRGKVKKSKTQNLLERFIRHKNEMLRFIRDFSIPFDNNLAEQAIRMMKVKQKISGCFRSKEGAQCFATIRSYIDTMRKQGHSIADALKRAVSGNPIQLTSLRELSTYWNG
jgi:transposase